MKETCNEQDQCPAESLLRQLSGKWKPQIFKIALTGPIRFNLLLRRIEGSNKQAIAVALREMLQQDLLVKTVINIKPLHIEYTLSEKGKSLISVFKKLEHLAR